MKRSKLTKSLQRPVFAPKMAKMVLFFELDQLRKEFPLLIEWVERNQVFEIRKNIGSPADNNAVSTSIHPSRLGRSLFLNGEFFPALGLERNPADIVLIPVNSKGEGLTPTSTLGIYQTPEELAKEEAIQDATDDLQREILYVERIRFSLEMMAKLFLDHPSLASTIKQAFLDLDVGLSAGEELSKLFYAIAEQMGETSSPIKAALISFVRSGVTKH